MGTISRLSYGTKTIDFPSPPVSWSIDPWVPRTINTTLVGDVETVMLPRLDNRIVLKFAQQRDQDLRRALMQFWQYAQQGNQFTFQLDRDKSVNTTTTNTEAVGSTSIQVTSATGITSGNYYVIQKGRVYQHVKCSGVSGTDITISEGLDIALPSGAVFRDEYLWILRLRDPSLSCPIVDLEGRDFSFGLDCYEVTA